MQQLRFLCFTASCLFMAVMVLSANISAEDKYPESSSIEPVKKGAPDIIIKSRKFGGKIRGHLVSFAINNVIIQGDGKSTQSGTFAWTDFDLVFAEGITNAAELLNSAKAKMSEIDDTLDNLSFTTDVQYSLDDLYEMRESALELSQRIMGGIGERVPGLDVLPAISEQDRIALATAQEFLTAIDPKNASSAYTYLKMKKRYETEIQKQGEVQQLWKRLENYDLHIRQGQYAEAQDELDWQLKRLKDKTLTPTELSIRKALVEVNDILTIVRKVDGTPTSIELSELDSTRKFWTEVEQALQKGAKIKAAGPVSVAAFEQQHEAFLKNIAELDLLIQETTKIKEISKEAQQLSQTLLDSQLSTDEQKKRFDKVRSLILSEREKWTSNDSSKFQKYAIDQLARLETQINAANATSSIKHVQELTKQYKTAIDSVRNPTEARMLATSFEQLGNKLKPFSTSPKNSKELNRESQIALKEIKDGREEALQVELKLHQRKLADLENSLASVLKKRNVLPAEEVKTFENGLASLSNIANSVKEIRELSPATSDDVANTIKSTGQLTDIFSKTVNIISVRTTINRLSTSLDEMQELDFAVKTLDEQRQLLTSLDLSGSPRLEQMHSWAVEETEQLQNQIEKAKPIITFKKESESLQQMLTKLAEQLPENSIRDSRVAAVTAEEHFNLIAGWLNENPELQVEANKVRLQEMQRQQQEIEEKIAIRVSEVRKKNGWIPYSVNGTNVLIPPESDYKMLLALSAADQKDYSTAERLVNELATAETSNSLIIPPDELKDRLVLREADQAESDGQIQKANDLYGQVAEKGGESPVTMAALTGIRRTNARLEEMNVQSHAKRQSIAAGIGVLALLSLIGVALTFQTKSVKLWQARRLIQKANRELLSGNTHQADLHVQSASRIVAQYSENDPDVVDLFTSLAPESRSANSQANSLSTRNVEELRPGEKLMWVCSSLDASESTVVSIVDQLETGSVSLKKKESQRLIQWLMTQFQNDALSESDSFSWQARELSRLCRLFPANMDFRLMLGRIYLKNRQYRETLETVAPLLKDLRSSRQKKQFQVAVHIVSEAFIALEEWDQLDKLAEKLNRGKGTASLLGERHLAIIGKRMSTEDSATHDLHRVRKSIDHLLK